MNAWMRRPACHVAACVALLLSFARAAFAAEAAAAPTPVVDPEAVAIAQRAGDFLRDHERFAFTAETAYEAVQEDGSTLEFGATRRYLVRRPDRVRVEVEPRSGPSRLIVFDGDQLSFAEPQAKVYAQLNLKQHRRIDEAVVMLREVFDMPLPLAELLQSDPRAELVGSLTGAYRVGTAKLAGVACDHLAFRNDDADLQLWIEQGAKPLLRRVVITYRDEPGAPSFAADLGDWKLDAKSSEKDFRYVPPKDVERIRFSAPPKPESGTGTETR